MHKTRVRELDRRWKAGERLSSPDGGRLARVDVGLARPASKGGEDEQMLLVLVALRTWKTWPLFFELPGICQSLVRCSPVEYKIMDFSGRCLLDGFRIQLLLVQHWILDTCLRQFTEAGPDCRKLRILRAVAVSLLVVDIPFVPQWQISMVQTLQQIIEIPLSPLVDVSVVRAVQSLSAAVEKTFIRAPTVAARGEIAARGSHC